MSSRRRLPLQDLYDDPTYDEDADRMAEIRDHVRQFVEYVLVVVGLGVVACLAMLAIYAAGYAGRLRNGDELEALVRQIAALVQ